MSILLLIAFTGLLHAEPSPPRTLGLLVNDSLSHPGYTLFAPLRSTQTYLIDHEGFVVQQWSSAYFPGQHAVLLDDGQLLRLGTLRKTGIPRFDSSAGVGGQFQIFDWDNTLLWNWRLCDSTRVAHHGVKVLPNGNLLVIAWELVTRDSALAWGRDSTLLAENELWMDMVLEIKRLPPGDAEIVWEWHLKDHLIQDFDSTKRFYGDVGAHPERMDINYFCDVQYKKNGENDWNHANAVDWHPQANLIMLDLRHQAEFLIVNRATTTEQARGPDGDILYRWGNPESWRAGDAGDRMLFGQHDPHWIADSLAGAGNVLVFDNGRGSPFYPWRSRVLEVELPPRERIASGTAWHDPAPVVWSYEPTGDAELYSAYVCNARRLPNGNTLVCSGWEGIISEVTMSGDEVWRYVIPENRLGRNFQGAHLTKNQIFLAYRYETDHPGLRDRDLRRRGTLERYVGLGELGVALIGNANGLEAWRNPFTGDLWMSRQDYQSEVTATLFDRTGTEIGEIEIASADSSVVSGFILRREFLFVQFP